MIKSLCFPENAQRWVKLKPFPFVSGLQHRTPCTYPRMTREAQVRAQGTEPGVNERLSRQVSDDATPHMLGYFLLAWQVMMLK